jgi:hypothetical protein
VKRETDPPRYAEKIVFPSVSARNQIAGRVASIENIIAKVAEDLQKYVLRKVM